MGTAMTDRADELARRVFENCTHGVSDYDAYGPCLRCTADALRAYAEEAGREEREACAKLVEDHGHSNGRIRASHKHLAAAMRTRDGAQS